MIIGHITLWVGACHPDTLVQRLMLIGVIEWKYNFLKFVTWPHDQIDICLDKWNPLNLSHHCAKFYACIVLWKWRFTSDITWPENQRDIQLRQSVPLKLNTIVKSVMFIGLLEVEIYFYLVTWHHVIYMTSHDQSDQRDMWLVSGNPFT